MFIGSRNVNYHVIPYPVEGLSILHLDLISFCVLMEPEITKILSIIIVNIEMSSHSGQNTTEILFGLRITSSLH